MMGNMNAHRTIIKAVFAGFMTAAAVSTWADAPAPPSAVPASTTTAAPSNQIWECTTNGLRTFSNNPCGTKSTVRQLNPINVMEPPPVYHVTHTYAPPASSTPVRSNYNPPPADSPEDTYTDNAVNAYPTYVVVTRAHRLRPNNAHNHPHPHHP